MQPVFIEIHTRTFGEMWRSVWSEDGEQTSVMVRGSRQVRPALF